MSMARRSSATTGWGGRRPGAGRKRATEEPLFSREVRLTMPQMAFLARYGGGRLAAGLRRLVDEALAREAAANAAPGA